MIKQLVFGVVALSMIPSESESASIAEAGEFHTALSEQVCLANNIYWEARNQTEEGMIGVGLVVRNRVLDNRFPHSYCEVVHQGPTRSSWRDPNVKIPVRHRCQFSWYCDGKSDDIIANELDIYTIASDIAHRIYSGAIDDVTSGATHYHADYVIPAWAATKIRTIKIDDHIFYRWEF